MNAIRYKPQAVVTFYTEQGQLVARGTNDPNSKMDDDILEISTSRNMGADAPTFSITLTRRKDWHKWVGSNDLVSIMMHRPPESQALVMVGLVDDCRKRLHASSDNVQRVITVSGRGFAKAFIQFDIGVVPEAGTKLGVTEKGGWVETAGISISGFRPSTIIPSTWDKIGKKYVNYKFSDGRSLFDMMNYEVKDRDNLILRDAASILNFQGSLWAFLKEIGETPFYELFWEMKGNIPTMTCRPTPFSKENWPLLPRIKVTDVEVLTEELGRSDVESYTLYSVGAKMLGGGDDPYKTFGTLPIWNKEYAKKYGIRRLQVNTKYCAVAVKDDAVNMSNIMKKLMVDLYNWNIKNNSMYNGSIVVRGSNQYKVGMVLVYESSEDNCVMEYYIKAVNHRFVNFNNWVTELVVTRGMTPAERFTPPYGTGTEYTGVGWLPFKPVGIGGSVRNAGSRTRRPAPAMGSASSKGAAAARLAQQQMADNAVTYNINYDDFNSTPMVLNCASWTRYVYGQVADIDIGGNAEIQRKNPDIAWIEREEAKAGDLIFFERTYYEEGYFGPTHVAICIGGDRFIHNSYSAKALVEAGFYDSYWDSHYHSCGRVFYDTSTDGYQTFQATAYGALENGNGDGITATGTHAEQGRTIAVDPDVIPLCSIVSIQCPSDPSIDGTYVAEDTGGAIKGNIIDIYFNDLGLSAGDLAAANERMNLFGRRDILVKVVGKEG